MITRYSVIFAAQMIEPDPAGKWIKFEDHANAEVSIRADAEERALAAVSDERSKLQGQIDYYSKISEKYDKIERDLVRHQQENAHYSDLVHAAKQRLNLLGHSPNCASRYARTEADGTPQGSGCNCGLDEWMRESGVHNG